MRKYLIILSVSLVSANAIAGYLRLEGSGIINPRPHDGSGNPPAYTQVQIDATDEKVAHCGQIVWENGTGSKSIQNVAFRLGTVTKTGGSNILVALQDISTTAGPPLQPDGTDDQTVQVPSADYSANSWIETNNLSANRTVNFGDYVCAVWTFDGARAGSDLFNINGVAAAVNTQSLATSVVVSSLSASVPWVIVSQFPTVAFKFSDGTYGKLMEGMPYNAINTHTFNSGSTPDERALAFYPRIPMKIDAIWLAYTSPNGGSAGTLSLYEGTTALETISISSITTASQGTAKVFISTITERELTVGTTYYVGYAPGSTNASAFSVGAENMEIKALLHGGRSHGYTQRTDAGAWDTIVSTQTFLAGYRISSLSDTTGSAGGTVGLPFAQ